MSRKFSPPAIESLRIDLQRLVHLARSDRYQAAVAALKCILLNRLAEREAELAVIESREIVATPVATGLMPSLTLAELQALQETTERVPPHKLD